MNLLKKDVLYKKFRRKSKEISIDPVVDPVVDNPDPIIKCKSFIDDY